MRTRTCLTCFIVLCTMLVCADRVSAEEFSFPPERPSRGDWWDIPETLVSSSWEVQAFYELVWFVSYDLPNYAHPHFWERVWGLDEPDFPTPYKVHGGVI